MTEKYLMARNFFRIFTENNPVMGYSKTFVIPEAKGLTLLHCMYSAFAMELSDLSKPFKFARLKGFERLENCPTKGTYEKVLKGETTL